MKENDHIGEHKIDELLNSYFLNEFSEEKDIALAQLVMDTDYRVEPGRQKEKDLIRKLSKKGGGNFLWMGLILALLSISLILFIHYNDEENITLTKIQQPVSVAEKEWIPSSGLQPVHHVNDSSINTIYKDIDPGQGDSSIIGNTVNLPLETDDKIPVINKMEKEKEEAPLFTKAEKAYYQRLKVSMIEKLMNADKDIYTHVDEGFVTYKKNKWGVNAFTNRNFAVTNMEYKTFLVDMLLKSNKKTLQRIMVDSKVWNDYQCGKLAEEYFNKNEYDGFPVVNISPEAALMFCKWLEKEVNINLLAKDPKAKPVKIRLPYDYEWISASKIGVAHVPRCDGYQTIYDINEGLINKAFLKRIDKIQQRDEEKKKKFDEFLAINRYGMSEEEMLRIFANIFPNNSASGNYPSELQDIAKVSHVSEFIQNPSGEIIVYGSCWESKTVYTKMLNEFKKNEASPFIGFRFVIEDEHSDTYKNPFW